MRFLTWYLVLAECLVVFAQAQDQHNACPGIEPIQDFQMSRYLGEWYAIQDTAMNGKCITYNYRQLQEPGMYVMLLTEYITIVNSVPHVVFMTDYDTYAGVLAYLPNSSGHRATIFSRTRTLDQMHVDNIRQKLSQCGFDMSNLKIIEHSDCPERSVSVTVPYNDTASITI